MVEFFGETLYVYAVVPLVKIIAAIAVVLTDCLHDPRRA